ncbi:hypothetical protein [Streptomyces sp. WAC00469]|uniref:hypothetical protein n=1 Tax=Streptomyces sp. WAC00469 TaxID=2487415 RepID=UPI000F73AACD|nr:hypothetical protein [Streptomyces sp. WAC00469]RSS04105.1 hypothetical protein EF917_11570 [Streptomyces sp. WAC00469]
MPGAARPRRPNAAQQRFNRPLPKQSDSVEAGPPLAALAAEARRRFAAAAAGSIDRKAAGAAAVALSTSRSVSGARRVLQTYRLDDVVRAEALCLLDELTIGAPAMTA